MLINPLNLSQQLINASNIVTSSAWYLIVPVVGVIVYRCLQLRDYRTRYQLVGPSQQYQPEKILEEMDKADSLKKKICLFVCRTENQSLPEVEGEFWMSGDRAVCGIIPLSRKHIWADFTKEEQTKKYHKRIDKVALDKDSAKYLGCDFESRLIKLLRPSKSAELVIENHFLTMIIPHSQPQVARVTKDIIYLPINTGLEDARMGNKWFDETYPKNSTQYQKGLDAFRLYIKELADSQKWDEEKYHESYRTYTIQTEFPSEKRLANVLYKQATEKRREFLKQKFDSVTLVKSHPYLPPSIHPSEQKEYFIAKGMK